MGQCAGEMIGFVAEDLFLMGAAKTKKPVLITGL
jgi:hypothetical protein